MPSKYGNVKSDCGMHTHDSKRERDRCLELQLMERAGAISDLVNQPKYDLIVDGTKIAYYKADFEYTDMETGKRITEDVKGMRTAIYRRSKKHMKAQYGIDILET